MLDFSQSKKLDERSATRWWLTLEERFRVLQCETLELETRDEEEQNRSVNRVGLVENGLWEETGRPN